MVFPVSGRGSTSQSLNAASIHFTTDALMHRDAFSEDKMLHKQLQGSLNGVVTIFHGLCIADFQPAVTDTRFYVYRSARNVRTGIPGLSQPTPEEYRRSDRTLRRQVQTQSCGFFLSRTEAR